MTGDWIKMRVDLYRDPKVTQMADYLLNDCGELASHVHQNLQRNDNVTRNVTRNARSVTRNAVVGALVAVWGVARHQGQRIGDDLVMCARANVLDDISELPGFGAAMLSSGWAVEDEDTLVFPRFFEENNVDPEDGRKAKNRARQQRYRDNQRDNQRDNKRYVTVTLRNAPRERGEKESSPKGEGAPIKKAGKTAAPARRVSVACNKITTLAGNLFGKIGYSGSDGAIIWKIAAALSVGWLSENDVCTAADNTKKSAKGNTVAYFRRALERRLAERDESLAGVLAMIRVTPRLPKSPPDVSSFGDDLAAKIKSE